MGLSLRGHIGVNSQLAGPDLKTRKNGGRKENEKVHGVHQLPSPAGDEEWEICPGLQTVPEDDPSGKSQAGHPGQQLPCSQEIEIEYYAMLAKAGVHHYSGNNIELGTA